MGTMSIAIFSQWAHIVNDMFAFAHQNTLDIKAINGMAPI